MAEFPDPDVISSRKDRPRPSRPGSWPTSPTSRRVARVAPEVARSIVQELADQRRNIKLIASENYSSLATQCAMGNLLTDKYAEGIPHHRFYAGCDNVDSIEDLANARACELFGAAHAYAQPHSGADANLVAFWAILRARVELPAMAKLLGAEDPDALAAGDWYKLTPEQWNEVRQSLGNQRLLGMDLASGGHLTHGYRLNSSGKMFESHGYTVDRETFLLDYDAIERQALEVKPLILLAGFSAYPRNINYRRMREIADKVGAVLMVDMAHFAGLVAGKVLKGDYNPIAVRRRRDDDDAQDPARAARGPGAVHDAGVQRRTSTAAARWCWAAPCPTSWPPRPSRSPRPCGPSSPTYAQKIVDNARALAEAFVRQGSERHHRRDRQPPGARRRRLGPSGSPAARPRRPSGAAGSRSTATRSPSTPTAPGTPAACGSAPRPSRPWAWARPRWRRSPRSSRWCSRTSSRGRPSRGQGQVEVHARRRRPRPGPRRVDDLLASYPVYPEIDLPFLQESFELV